MVLPRTVLLVTFLLNVVSWNGIAMAAPADDAEVFVKRGIDLRKDFKDREALEEFLRAYQIARTPRIEAQIGVAEQALGRWVEAEQHVSSALSEATDSWIAKNRAALEQSLTSIRTHLGSLEIIGSPPGAEVRIDGRSVGTLPLSSAQRVAAGKVVVELRAPGHLPVSRTVTISAEELTRETVTLQPSATSAAAVPDTTRVEPVALPPHSPSSMPPPSVDVRPWQRPLAWTLAGGALVFGAGAVAALVVRNGKADDYNRAVDSTGCIGPNAETCRQLRSEGDSAQMLALVGFAVSGALAVTSTLLFLATPDPPASGVATFQGCAVDWISKGIRCRAAF